MVEIIITGIHVFILTISVNFSVSVSGTGFSPNRTFSVARKIRSPDTSLKRGVPGNCLIRPDLRRITAYRRRAQPIKSSSFTLKPLFSNEFPRYYMYNGSLHDT